VIYFNRSTIDPNRVTQIILNTIVFIALAGASGFGSFSRLKNPQFQNALILGSLPIALIAYYFGLQADEQEPFDRMRREANLQIGAGQLAAEIEMPSLPMPAPMALPASSPAADESEAIAFFDWQLIQTKPDKYAHLAIVGGTGDGKTTLTQSLLQFLGEKVIAIDPHWRPGNYPGIPTVAKGRNYGSYPADAIAFEDLLAGADCSYTEAIATIHAEMDRRYKLVEKGQSVGERYSFIFDEYTTFAGVHPKCSKGEVLSLIREARKVGLRLILLVHSDLLKDFHWQGQGAARKSLRWCRLGEFAKTFAKGQKDEILLSWVESQNYPILVEDMPAILPVPLEKLACFVGQSNRIKEQNTFDAIKNYLDNLYKLPGYQKSDHDTSSQPPGDTGSLSGSLGVTQSGQGIQPQPDTSDLWFSLTAKEGYPAAILGSRSLLVVVRSLKNEGQNQEQIIRLLWGLPKNGKPKYKQAVEEYKSLLGEI
jgi:hypothetical protein